MLQSVAQQVESSKRSSFVQLRVIRSQMFALDSHGYRHVTVPLSSKLPATANDAPGLRPIRHQNLNNPLIDQATHLFLPLH